jgi:hypothetical protein
MAVMDGEMCRVSGEMGRAKREREAGCDRA